MNNVKIEIAGNALGNEPFIGTADFPHANTIVYPFRNSYFNADSCHRDYLQVLQVLEDFDHRKTVLTFRSVDSSYTANGVSYKDIEIEVKYLVHSGDYNVYVKAQRADTGFSVYSELTDSARDKIKALVKSQVIQAHKEHSQRLLMEAVERLKEDYRTRLEEMKEAVEKALELMEGSKA